MKAYIKYYLFYAAIFLIGASVSAGLFFAYRASLFPTDIFDASASFRFGEYMSLTATVLTPLTLVFLSAFTIYACAVSGVACLYVGAIFGRLTIRYCVSDHNVFTHAACLLILITFGAVFVIISKEASMCRTALRSVAPDPSQLMKAQCTISLFKTYMSSCITVIISCIAVYMLTLYFQL